MANEKKHVTALDFQTFRLRFASLGILLLATLLIVFITIFMYSFTANLLKDRLNQRVNAITSTSVLLFNGDEIETLIKLGSDAALKTDTYRKTVEKLGKIKRANENLTFAYILAPTKDLTQMQFIADADVIALRPSLNFNIDEITEEGFPGSIYDVSEIKVIQDGSAFTRNIINPDVYVDEWGTLYTGYAPIFNSEGRTIAVLALDVDISDYNSLVKATFLPFGLLTILMIMTLAFLGISLLRMWGSRVELLRELDRQKDELLSIVSHQLATPVSSVKWYLEMLLDGDVGVLSKEQQEYLNTMQSVTYNLADLVSMILDVSRIQLGKMKVDAQPLDLNLFFKEILFAIEPKAKEKEQKFDVSIPNDLPKAMLDKRLTRMTIENLLSNAVKYTPAKGTVKWFMELRGTMLYMEVRDTGCGIPEKDQKQIFGKLFRASNTGAIDGNGFGLYVAKGAIEAQGGKIWFESKENKGTTFFVELPLKSPPSEAK